MSGFGSTGPASEGRGRVLVLAKAPVPGRVKTRLCPPCTPEQAASIAAAALADTLDRVAESQAGERILVVDGHFAAPAGWITVPQRDGLLGPRLAAAFADTARDGDGADGGALLIGMDTPQVSVALLDEALRRLATHDAVFGPAADGGWWALGLRDPGQAEVLRDIPTSTSSTGALTLAALRARGLRVAMLPVLRDVDTASDAVAAAADCSPASRFARAVAAGVMRAGAGAGFGAGAGAVRR